MKHLIGAGLVVMLAFAVRFVLPLSFGVDIHVHDTYRVIPVRIVIFWTLLILSAAWLVVAAFKAIRTAS